ncbi:sperm acrosome-associated protein 5-like [Anabas testudineus]|uniref:sperm acrosome-associated protein 5-like n=1 Tax=Anabas testudineus TaxID=64144 RepID=UPI000E460802|nr:sperm acrosome-associated protein 5-like [Anabas testudineus]
MKVLVVFVLAVLGCSLAEGVIVAKCDLRNQLKTATSQLTVSGRRRVLSGDDLVARFVCHAEKSSGFNTSAVKELAAGQEDHEHRGKGLPHSWEERHNGTFLASPPEPWMLYGIFQLGSRIACDDSVHTTDNICGIPCSNLLDDDISDDISCLVKFFTSGVSGSTGPSGSGGPSGPGSPSGPGGPSGSGGPSGPGAPSSDFIRNLMKMLHLIFDRDCRRIKATDYFVGCPAPPN